MNKELEGKIFDIPQHVLNKINHTIVGLNGEHYDGLNRAKRLLSDKKVKYGQLKRIIHDFQTMDKIKESRRYDLYGGVEMERWALQFLKGERDLISGRKDSRQQADNIGGIDGERANSHLKKHTKKASWLPPVNLIKSNSDKTSVSQITSLKLFEEVERIKKLM
jgi:hypothetical protein